MKASDVMIRKCFLCTLDPRDSYVSYNEFIPGEGDEVGKYIKKLVIYNRGNIQAKPSSYSDDSYLMQILPESEESMESFVNLIAEELFGLMKENGSILPGCGLFVWVLMEEQNYIAFFKLDYQSRLMNAVTADGRVAWKLNQNLLPVSSQKAYEFFLINMDMQRIWVSDKKHSLNFEEPVNVIASELLKVHLDKSEKELIECIDDVMMDTIYRCCAEDAQEKVFEYKNAMAQKVQDDGRLHMGEIVEELFADNEAAETLCKDQFAQNRIPQIPVIVGDKIEKKLRKKHKLVTSSGIEILVPPELLQDESCFAYEMDPMGNIMITIKDQSGVSLDEVVEEM